MGLHPARVARRDFEAPASSAASELKVDSRFGMTGCLPPAAPASSSRALRLSKVEILTTTAEGEGADRGQAVARLCRDPRDDDDADVGIEPAAGEHLQPTSDEVETTDVKVMLAFFEGRQT